MAMPLSNEVMFTVGSFIKIHTLREEIITGEVLAFQYELKLMVLKSQSPNNPKTHTVTVVNLAWCKDVQIINESDGINAEDVSTLPEMNLLKIEQRVKNATNSRRATLDAYAAGVTAQGVQLYISLIKTFGSSVHLKKSSIIVKTVQVIPPYSQDCVLSLRSPAVTSPGMTEENDSIVYIRQLVDKFWQDQNIDSMTLEPLVASSKVSSSTSPSTLSLSSSNISTALESLTINGGDNKEAATEAATSKASNKTNAHNNVKQQQNDPGGQSSTAGKTVVSSTPAAASDVAPKGKGSVVGPKSQQQQQQQQPANPPLTRN